MPFKSASQRRYLYAKEPEVAEEFEAATPKDAKLPEHVGGVSKAPAKKLIGKRLKKA